MGLTVKPSNEFVELVFDGRVLCRSKWFLGADDDIHMIQLALVLPEQLTQDALHIITLDRQARRLFPDNQSQPREGVCIVLIMQGE